MPDDSAQGGDGTVGMQPGNAALQPALAAPPTATFTIKPPEPFDFTKPHEWEKWIRRFECFRLASNLNSSSEANQVNKLVYCMRDEADNVLRRLDLTPEQWQRYKAVKNGYDRFFLSQRETSSMNWSNSTREYRSLHSQWTFSSQHFLHWQRTVSMANCMTIS